MSADDGPDAYSILVAYLPEGVDVTQFWPEATHIDSEPCPEGIRFTSRFPRPDWWDGEGEEVTP